MTACKEIRKREKEKGGMRERGMSIDSTMARLFTYHPDEVAVTFRGQALQLNELSRAANTVSHELSLQSKRGFSLSPRFPTQQASLTLPPPSTHTTKPVLSPVYKYDTAPGEPTQTTLTLSAPKKTKSRRVTVKPRAKPPSDSGLHTAQDVIAAFATGNLKAGAESVYLNYAAGSPWNPYSLTVVSKTRADPEHYVISKFGILHVQSDGSADLQNFAEWLREAGLFLLCRKIPFFRQYLLRKTIRHWHRNVCYSHFVHLQSLVGRVGVQFFPVFQEAVQQIHRLNQELLGLPVHTLTPLGEHSVELFEKSVEGTAARMQRFFQRYFKYCRRVVSEVIRTTWSHAQELETEKRHQPFVSDLPISIQTEKHAALERELAVAKYRVGRLGGFVMLVEQMMGVSLLMMTRQAAEEWVEHTLGLGEASRKLSLDQSVASNSRSSPSSEEAESSSDLDDQGQPCALLQTELRVEGGEGDQTDRRTDRQTDRQTERRQTERGQKLCIYDFILRSYTGTLVMHPTEEKLVSMLTTPLHTIPTLITSTTSPPHHACSASRAPTGAS